MFRQQLLLARAAKFAKSSKHSEIQTKQSLRTTTLSSGSFFFVFNRSYHAGKAASVDNAIKKALRDSHGIAFRGKESNGGQPTADDPREIYRRRNNLPEYKPQPLYRGRGSDGLPKFEEPGRPHSKKGLREEKLARYWESRGGIPERYRTEEPKTDAKGYPLKNKGKDISPWEGRGRISIDRKRADQGFERRQPLDEQPNTIQIRRGDKVTMNGVVVAPKPQSAIRSGSMQSDRYSSWPLHNVRDIPNQFRRYSTAIHPKHLTIGSSLSRESQILPGGSTRSEDKTARQFTQRRLVSSNFEKSTSRPRGFPHDQEHIPYRAANRDSGNAGNKYEHRGGQLSRRYVRNQERTPNQIGSRNYGDSGNKQKYRDQPPRPYLRNQEHIPNQAKSKGNGNFSDRQEYRGQLSTRHVRNQERTPYKVGNRDDQNPSNRQEYRDQPSRRYLRDQERIPNQAESKNYGDFGNRQEYRVQPSRQYKHSPENIPDRFKPRDYENPNGRREYQGRPSRRSEPTANQTEEASSTSPPRVIRNLQSGVPLSIPYTTTASEFLYGTSVVEAALSSIRSPRRKLYKLYIYTGENRGTAKKDAMIESLALMKGVEVVYAGNDWLRLLDKMSGGRPHNGYILEASPLPKLPVTALGQVTTRNCQKGFEVLVGYQSKEDAIINGSDDFIPVANTSGRNPFVLYLDSILDPGNLGGIIRTAHFLGASAIAISERNTARISPVVLKASAGASENITLLSVDKPAAFVVDSKNAGWKVFAAVAPSKKNDPDIPLSLSSNELGDPLIEAPCILMLGSEGEGLRWNLRSKADVDVYIPWSGNSDSIDSLNVSVAAGVLCNAFLAKPDVDPKTPPVQLEQPQREKVEKPMAIEEIRLF